MPRPSTSASASGIGTPAAPPTSGLLRYVHDVMDDLLNLQMKQTVRNTTPNQSDFRAISPVSASFDLPGRTALQGTVWLLDATSLKGVLAGEGGP